MMKNLKISLKGIALFAVISFGPLQTSFLFSQSEFLDSGVSAFSIAASSAFRDNYLGFSAGMGYSISGLVDLGVEGGKSTLKYLSGHSGEESAIRSQYFSPVICINVFKQNDKFPASILFEVRYSWISYSGEYISEYQDDLPAKAQGLFFGGGISSKIRISPKSGLVPLIYAGHASIITFESFINTYGINLSVFFDFEKDNIFFFTPAFVVGEDKTVFGISAGFVL